jgi:radical SAM superfamily enzyme YgiQ (UPF0313 family)
MVRPQLLTTMKRAGLVHVNFGVESGDDDILKAIRKGITTDQVVRALEWAKEAGLMTACNFMLGFPEDTPYTLERTRALHGAHRADGRFVQHDGGGGAVPGHAALRRQPRPLPLHRLVAG